MNKVFVLTREIPHVPGLVEGVFPDLDSAIGHAKSTGYRDLLVTGWVVGQTQPADGQPMWSMRDGREQFVRGDAAA